MQINSKLYSYLKNKIDLEKSFFELTILVQIFF